MTWTLVISLKSAEVDVELTDIPYNDMEYILANVRENGINTIQQDKAIYIPADNIGLIMAEPMESKEVSHE
jgi:hypothetical protein